MDSSRSYRYPKAWENGNINKYILTDSIRKKKQPKFAGAFYDFALY